MCTIDATNLAFPCYKPTILQKPKDCAHPPTCAHNRVLEKGKPPASQLNLMTTFKWFLTEGRTTKPSSVTSSWRGRTQQGSTNHRETGIQMGPLKVNSTSGNTNILGPNNTTKETDNQTTVIRSHWFPVIQTKRLQSRTVQLKLICNQLQSCVLMVTNKMFHAVRVQLHIYRCSILIHT